MRSSLPGLLLLLAACGPEPAPTPFLGPLAAVETVGVRLGLETRPALTDAENGRARLEAELQAGHLVLAFGWRGEAVSDEPATVRVSFRRQGAERELTTVSLPVATAAEGWAEAHWPVPAELAGQTGSLVFETPRLPHDLQVFTALPELVPERDGNRPNIILVSIDTLRSDRLGCYGHERPTSPAVDRLAREGTLFANAIAQSGWTLPSHYTMMTGLYPSAHGVNPDRWAFAGIRGSHETFRIRGSGKEEMLAERLRELGYFTAAITEGGWVNPHFGFEQGFASYVSHSNDNLAGATQAMTLRWLEEHRELPFFLFIHTYQAHQPYHQPPPYDTMFVDADHLGYALPGARLPIELLDKFKDGSFPPTRADIEAFRGLYDGAVRYVDAFIEAFLGALEEHGIGNDTIVLFTSDHGEELFEHGNFDHGETLYDEVMRVPMILWGPGRVPAGRTVDAVTASVDIFPTLLDLAGTPLDPGAVNDEETIVRVQGHSLTPFLGEGIARHAGRPVFAEGYADESVPIAGVWLDRHKAIFYGAELERAELFDLLADPGETRDLSAQDPERIEHLRRLVLDWQKESHAIQAELGEARTGIDPETEERLRALGYL